MANEPKDFVHERFHCIDAKLERLLASSEVTNARLTLMERRITGLAGSIVEVHERMDGMQGSRMGSAGASTAATGVSS